MSLFRGTKGRISYKLLLISGIALLPGCSITKFVGKQALSQQVSYVNKADNDVAKLTRINDRVWTFGYHFDRNLVIDTEDGLVIVDPFSEEMVAALQAELLKAGITKNVHTLVYSHYHMDHTSGGANLRPQNVLCHEKCTGYWSKFPSDETAAVLPVTQTISTDTTIVIGGVRIEMIYLDQSHTDTNFGIYLPDDQVLFLADTVGIRSLLPAGGVSVFMPDYIASLEKLSALDFKYFVSSHFQWGTKADFLEAVTFQTDSRRWIKEAVLQAKAEDTGQLPFLNSKNGLPSAFDSYYGKMKEKYGTWHGFDAQILPTFFNGFLAYHVGT
jgi:glyoxylase-like metal-dependent hydrolase (beta-lactamase superfamily II)